MCVCVCVCGVCVCVCARVCACGCDICVPDIKCKCVSLSSWQPVIDYCNEKYDQYLRDESGLNRRNIEDHRVHCCLYFINPLGHG